MFFRPSPKKQFPALQEAFLAYCRSDRLLPEEAAQPPLFFNAPPVKDLISLGAEHNEFLPDIVKTLGSIESMSIYRGALCGYLIGLYGESDIADPKADLALGRFYLRMLALAEEYVATGCRMLGITPQQLFADNEDNEENDDNKENAEPDWAEELLALDTTLIAAANPEAALCWQSFEPLSFGMMSRLAGSRELRFWLRSQDDGQLIRRCQNMGELRQAVGFIPYMLRLTEEERLLLLAPATGCGVEVEAREIDSNNQFFTLLQYALYHAGLLAKLGAADFRPRPAIEKAARHLPMSEAEQAVQLWEQGCFGYYTYPAWQEGDYNEMEPVWGEGDFSEIPRLEGRLVILLTKPRIQRSWGNAFICGTHSGLRPSVEVVRELSPNEVNSWLVKIRAANAQADA